MAFVIKPLRYEDLDRIYPDSEDEQIRKYDFAKSDWPDDMHHHNWVVDEQSGVFLLRTPNTREGISRRYIFGMPGGVAILREKSYCLYTLLHVSQTLISRMDEVKSQIREAFRVAGNSINGMTDDYLFAVPNAQFDSEQEMGEQK